MFSVLWKVVEYLATCFLSFPIGIPVVTLENSCHFLCPWVLVTSYQKSAGMLNWVCAVFFFVFCFCHMALKVLSIAVVLTFNFIPVRDAFCLFFVKGKSFCISFLTCIYLFVMSGLVVYVFHSTCGDKRTICRSQLFLPCWFQGLNPSHQDCSKHPTPWTISLAQFLFLFFLHLLLPFSHLFTIWIVVVNVCHSFVLKYVLWCKFSFLFSFLKPSDLSIPTIFQPFGWNHRSSFSQFHLYPSSFLVFCAVSRTLSLLYNKTNFLKAKIIF